MDTETKKISVVQTLGKMGFSHYLWTIALGFIGYWVGKYGLCALCTFVLKDWLMEQQPTVNQVLLSQMNDQEFFLWLMRTDSLINGISLGVGGAFILSKLQSYRDKFSQEE